MPENSLLSPMPVGTRADRSFDTDRVVFAANIGGREECANDNIQRCSAILSDLPSGDKICGKHLCFTSTHQCPMSPLSLTGSGFRRVSSSEGKTTTTRSSVPVSGAREPPSPMVVLGVSFALCSLDSTDFVRSSGCGRRRRLRISGRVSKEVEQEARIIHVETRSSFPASPNNADVTFEAINQRPVQTRRGGCPHVPSGRNSLLNFKIPAEKSTIHEKLVPSAFPPIADRATRSQFMSRENASLVLSELFGPRVEFERTRRGWRTELQIGARHRMVLLGRQFSIVRTW